RRGDDRGSLDEAGAGDQELRGAERRARHGRALRIRAAHRSPRLRVALGVGPRDPRRGAGLPDSRRGRDAAGDRRADQPDQARHRGAGAPAAKPDGGRQGARHARRHLEGPAHPRPGGRLVRARVRRRGRPVQAPRSPLRAEFRHSHAPVDGRPRLAPGRRVQSARGPDAGAAGPAAAPPRAPAPGAARRAPRPPPPPPAPPPPPILIGGYVDAVLKRVATRGDGWLTYFYTPESYRRSWD